MAGQDKACWAKPLAAMESCDLSQREFATERIPLSNLRYWIFRLRKNSRPLVHRGARGVWSSS